MRKTIILVAYLVFSSSIVFAVPSITSFSGDTDTHGNTLTVGGSGFDTKTTAAPLIYDSMDNYTGDTVATNGAYDDDWSFALAQDSEIAVEDTESISRNINSSYYAVCDIYEKQSAGFSSISSMGDKANIYVSFWARKNWVWGEDGDTAYGNFKISRVEHSEVVGGGKPNCYVGLPYTDRVATTAEFSTAGSSQTTAFARDTLWPDDTWVFIECFYKISNTAGSSDFQFWFNGTNYLDYQGYDMACDDMRGFMIAAVQNVRSTGKQTTDRFWIDDMYIDDTQQRVQIRQGAVIENQIPTAWSDTALSLVFNKGSLSDGAATLRVYDSDGGYGDYSITIGDSSTSTSYKHMSPGIYSSGRY